MCLFSFHAFSKIPAYMIWNTGIYLLDSIDFKWELLPSPILTLIKAPVAQLWKEANDDNKIGFWSICQMLSICSVKSTWLKRVQICEEKLPSKPGHFAANNGGGKWENPAFQ